MTKPGELTGKQQRFVEEYMVDMNATQAARRAGYSEKAVKQIGTENLAKPLIASAIKRAKEKLSAKTGITVKYVLEAITDTIERCQQASPVRGKDGKVIKGEYQFNAAAVLKGAELLGRHMAMFTDKVESKVQLESMTDDEIDAKLAAYDDKATHDGKRPLH